MLPHGLGRGHPFQAGLGAPRPGAGSPAANLLCRPRPMAARALPWGPRWCADASSLVFPDGLSEVRNLPKQKAELFSNRFENYEKNMKTPIEE